MLNSNISNTCIYFDIIKRRYGGGGSPGTPASSTTKTGRYDIAEILLKVALNTKIQIQIHFLFRFNI